MATNSWSEVVERRVENSCKGSETADFKRTGKHYKRRIKFNMSIM